MFNSAIPWTVAHHAPLSMGFPRQEYWSGLPFPPAGDLPDPGITHMSPALASRFFIAESPGKPIIDGLWSESERASSSVMSSSLTPWTVAIWLLCLWNSPGKNTGVGCHFLLAGDLPNPGIEPRSPALQADSLLFEPLYHVSIRSCDYQNIFRSLLQGWMRLQLKRGAKVLFLSRRWENSLNCWSSRIIYTFWINQWWLNKCCGYKLKLRYFGHLMWKDNSLEKTLMLGKIECRRRVWHDEMVGCIIDSKDMNVTKLWETVKEQARLACCSLWSHKELGTTQQLNNNNSNKTSVRNSQLWGTEKASFEGVALRMQGENGFE